MFKNLNAYKFLDQVKQEVKKSNLASEKRAFYLGCCGGGSSDVIQLYMYVIRL